MGATFVGEPEGAAPGQSKAAVTRKSVLGGSTRAIDVGQARQANDEFPAEGLGSIGHARSLSHAVAAN